MSEEQEFRINSMRAEIKTLCVELALAIKAREKYLEAWKCAAAENRRLSEDLHKATNAERIRQMLGQK